MAPSQPLTQLDTDQITNLQHLIDLRIDGTPLAHLTERQHFMGLELLAGPAALVPRLETELLAGVALDIAQSSQSKGLQPRIVDVCTGSGNVALALARHCVPAVVAASDLSSDAIELALKNAEHLNLSGRIEFKVGDLLEPFQNDSWMGSIDLLTCNPPYISSLKVPAMAAEIADHEPALAFDGGPFGVSILMRLVQEAPRFLKPGGWLAFEVGLGQGPAMEKRIKSGGHFGVVKSHQDSEGRVRVLSAQRT
jgi:release factor glutamine methyltransferase